MRSTLVATMLGFATTLGAQATRTDSAFVDLQRDGNGIAALSARVVTGFDAEPASSALRSIAATARLNLTFDSRLPGLGTRVTIPWHPRTVGAALIEIADAAKLRVRVAPSGQVIVVAPGSTAPPPRIVAKDPSTRATALPAMITEGERAERAQFRSTATIGGVTMTGSALRSTPAFVEPDLLRSVQLLPGIEARSDYSVGFNVRGGESDQNLVMLDGYPIYNPYHLGGAFGTFIDPTIGRVELRRGSLPAAYGGRLSGLLDVQSAEPTRSDLHGTAEVSLISSTASIGKGFADGNGSWMLAARRTYADAVADVVLHPGAFPYHFQDVQLHAARTVAGTRVALTAYDGLDVTASKDADVLGVNWGNSVVGTTIARPFTRPRMFGRSLGDSIVAEQKISFTRFDSRVDDRNVAYHANDRVSDLRIAGSLAFHLRSLSETVGYEASAMRLSFYSNGDFGDIIPLDSIAQRSRSVSAYADQLWHVTPSLLLETGLRADRVQEAHWIGWSPRASLKYFVSDDFALTAGGGRYAQWMHSLGREEEPVQPLQFWVASDSALPVSRSSDATLGVERWITPRRLLHVEAFYKRYDNVARPNIYSDPAIHGDEFEVDRGSSRGIDFLLRELEGGSFSGWISYTYMLSSRTKPDGVVFAPTQDRRHNLNLVGSWRDDATTWGVRVALASGLPATAVLGQYTREHYNPFTQRWVPDPASADDEVIPGTRNGIRLPWYRRIDVSWTRAGHVGGLPVSPYLSIVNVLNFHNPAAYMYTYGSRRERISFPNLPFAPTFGVSLAY